MDSLDTFTVEPDGKYMKYVGSEDDENNIVVYYMPVERYNRLREMEREKEKKIDDDPESIKLLETKKLLFKDLYEIEKRKSQISKQIEEVNKQLCELTEKVCNVHGHIIGLDTYRCDHEMVGLNAFCQSCGKFLLESEPPNILKNIKDEILKKRVLWCCENL